MPLNAPMGSLVASYPVKIQLTGDRELASLFENGGTKSELLDVVQKAMFSAMRVVVDNIKGRIPPAVSRPKLGSQHNTGNIRVAIGRSFKRNTITGEVEAKVGVNVGNSIKHPFAHIYMGGSMPRYTRVRTTRRSAIVKGAQTKTKKAYVRLAPYREFLPGRPKYRGFVLPKRYVLDAGSQGKALIQREVGMVVDAFVRQRVPQRIRRGQLPKNITITIRFN